MSLGTLAGAVVAVALAAPSPPLPAHGWSADRLSPRHPLVILAPRPEARRAALVVRFHSGAVDDGDKPGLTRVAQHTLLEASRAVRYRDLVRQVLGADATLDLETGLGECSFTLEAGRGDFDRLAAVVLDLLLSPDLDPGAFASARQSARHAEREGNGRDMLAMIAALVVDDPAFGNRPTGTEAGVEAVVLDDVRNQLAGPLAPANATVVLAGGFNVASALRTLGRLSGGKAVDRTPPLITTPFSLQIPSRREVYLVAYRTTYETPEQVAVARLATALMEERIFWFFRDRGVGYSQAVEPIRRTWTNLFLVTLPARDPAGIPLIPLLEEEMAAVRDGHFSDADFARNRSWVLASMERIDAEPLALASALADGNGAVWFGPDVTQALQRLDREGFVRGAAQLLTEPASVRILYWPQASRRGAIPQFSRQARGAR
jgi:hypothetical protein